MQRGIAAWVLLICWPVASKVTISLRQHLWTVWEAYEKIDSWQFFYTESVHLAFEYGRESFRLRKEELPYSHWFLVECFCFQHVILASEISRVTATQDSGKYLELHMERVQTVKKNKSLHPNFCKFYGCYEAFWLGVPWHQGPDGHLLKTVCVFFCNLKRAILEDQIVCFTIWDAKISRGSQKRDVACPTRYHLSEKYVYSLGPALASLFAISVRRGGTSPELFVNSSERFVNCLELFMKCFELFTNCLELLRDIWCVFATAHVLYLIGLVWFVFGLVWL